MARWRGYNSTPPGAGRNNPNNTRHTAKGEPKMTKILRTRLRGGKEISVPVKKLFTIGNFHFAIHRPVREGAIKPVGWSISEYTTGGGVFQRPTANSTVRSIEGEFTAAFIDNNLAERLVELIANHEKINEVTDTKKL
jgi:hypothetical protein